MNDHKTNFHKQIETIVFNENENEEDANRLMDSLDDEDGEEQEERVDPSLKMKELAIYDHQDSQVAKTEDQNNDLVDDYHYSRDTLYGLIDRGKTALEGALMVAQESEHPRAYEVTSTIMKNLSDMTKQLMEVSDSMAKGSSDGGSGKDEKSKPTHNTQINNYYGDKSVDDVLDDLDDE